MTMIKVKAIRKGYYGHLREVGDVFDVNVLGTWVEPVEPLTKEQFAEQERITVARANRGIKVKAKEDGVK